MENKLIIAGAEGYIGQRIQKRIPANNYQSLLLSIEPHHKYIPFDLLKLSSFDFGLIGRSDTVVLLAGISSPDDCNKNYQYSFNINVIGTIQFIKSCLKNGARVLFFSSDTIYGKSSRKNDEDFFPVNPVGEYANMKLTIEKYFRNELNFKAFRLSYVFSWNDKFMKYLRECHKSGNTAEIYDPLIRKAIYIEDLITCVFNIHSRWEEFNNPCFNICGPEYLSRLEIANLFHHRVGPLNLKLIRPGIEFFRARPQKINFSSKYSLPLLGRNFTPIKEAIEYEKGFVF